MFGSPLADFGCRLSCSVLAVVSALIAGDFLKMPIPHAYRTYKSGLVGFVGTGLASIYSNAGLMLYSGKGRLPVTGWGLRVIISQFSSVNILQAASQGYLIKNSNQTNKI